MAQLVKCFDCGNNISSEASFCPSCNSRSPHGEECAVCLQRGRYQDMFVDQFYNFEAGGAYQQRCLHKDCQRAVLKTSLRCPTCRQSVSFWSLTKLWDCPHCGQFVTGGAKCYYCNQPVHTKGEEIVTWEYIGHDSSDHLCVSSHYAHAQCSSSGPRLVSQKRDQDGVDNWKLQQQQRRQREEVEKQEREKVNQEIARRAKKGLCALCGKKIATFYLGLIVLGDSWRDWHPPGSSNSCKVHEACVKKPFSW